MDGMFSRDLALYGPEAKIPKPLRPRQGRRYCRRLARRHYENFTVVSWLLPWRLRQHFYNVYAYCRWADDLADEPGDPQQSLSLLDWWEKELRDCYAGTTRHPVFVALADTIRRYSIPIDPFIDLLVAFRQDQRVRRYDDLGQLTQYCRYSANPVGRLILYLGKCHTPERAQLADSICTGLQLANFWQDVARDWDMGRVYLPAADRARFGYDDEMFARREVNDAFRRLMAAEVDLAEGHLAARIAAGPLDAAGIAARRGPVHPRRAGHPAGHSAAELRRLDLAAGDFQEDQAAAAVEMLVGTEAGPACRKT